MPGDWKSWAKRYKTPEVLPSGKFIIPFGETSYKRNKRYFVNRKDFIRAISHLLESADEEALYLVWIAARNLTRKEAKSHD